MTHKHTKVRAWIFTLNNYTEEDKTKFINFKDNKQIKYFICGCEIAPTTGTPHIQGYIHFVNAKTREQTRKFISLRAHLKKAKGEDTHNQAYCSKENLLCEYGTPAQPGSRTDIKKMKQQINDHVPLKEIIQDCTSYQAMRTAELLSKYQSAPPIQKRNIYWFYGPTGCGKTYAAMELVNMDTTRVHKKNNSLDYWQLYHGQELIILDDFRPNLCKFTDLLGLLDIYPYQLPVKFGAMYLAPTTKTIVITAPMHPKDMYFSNDEELQQLLRRIDLIKEFNIKYIKHI